MVPLDLRVPILGRCNAWLGVRLWSSPLTDEAEEPGVADAALESEGATEAVLVVAAGRAVVVEVEEEGGGGGSGDELTDAVVDGVAVGVFDEGDAIPLYGM